MRILLTTSITSLALLAGAPALAQSGSDTGGDAADGSSDSQAEQQMEQLAIGDAMPALDAADELQWYNLDDAPSAKPIDEWKDGHIYVLDFWATWCGPCIDAMPHMIDMQEKYADKNVHMLGVHIFANPASPSVESFLSDWEGDEFNYAFVRETGTWAANTFMRAAGQTGIPTVMIVNREGKLSWIGHPIEMDEPLEQIVAGEYDLEEALEEQQLQLRMQEVMASDDGRAIIADLNAANAEGDYQKLFDKLDELIALAPDALGMFRMQNQYPIAMVELNDKDLGDRVAQQFLGTPYADDPMLLNQFAWGIVQPGDGNPYAANEMQDADLAVKLAERAAELTDRDDADVLDTLARAYFVAEQPTKAVETQRKAIELAKANESVSESVLDDYNERLKTYEEAVGEMGT
jgi:thiol-disulfide isomerase/thioredoxin